MASKSFLTSKTIIGVLIAVLSQAANRYLGFDIGGDIENVFSSVTADVISVGGAVLALFGRIKATKSLKV